MTRALIIGGSGVFGVRLAEGLQRLDGVEVILAGRDHARLRSAATTLRRPCHVLVLDTRTLTPDDIADSGADIVIDAAGPFQGAIPRTAEAAIAAGVHYADLADARDFVADFPRLDAAARAAGVFALTGVSSTPALSHAALDELTRGWHRVDTIRVGIAPGNRAPRGPSVVAAILTWVGAPVRVFEHGRWRTRPGWSGTRRTPIGDLGRRPLALAETPDLDLLVERYHPARNARFEAGLELGLLHYGLVIAGWLRRMRLLPSLKPLAGPARRAADLLLPFGTDRGGMIVEVTGRDASNTAALARWTLIAEAGDGPYVPTLAAVALVNALAQGEPIAPGARACAGTLTLAQITAQMKPLRLRTHIATQKSQSVFERAIGPDFSSLPRAIRRGHDAGPTIILRGRATVEGAATLPGRLARLIAGLPPAMNDAEIEVAMEVRPDGSEVWRRNFNGHRFRTVLTTEARGSYLERLGPLTIDCAIAVTPRGIEITPRAAHIGKLRLPGFLTPGGSAREVVDSQGRFRFDVSVTLPLIGQVARYHGWLVPTGPRELADMADG